MTSPTSDRLLRVADLLDRPGASRRVDLAVHAPDDLAPEMARVVEPLHLHGVVESVVDGLLVRGVVRAEVQLDCARCLTPLVRTVDADVVELFSDPAHADPDDDIEAGYEISDGTIDLDTLLRDALVPALPYRPLCDADCQGLCPQCGANRNEVDCGCVETTTDGRWAALEALRLREQD